MPASSNSRQFDGLGFALGAHAIWGIMPLYLMLVKPVDPVEFVAWRIVFTLPVCLLAVAVRRQWSEIRTALADSRSLLALLASSLLIGVNWLLYVVAIQTDHVYAASLGYYILPLAMMVLGMVVLKERLSRPQWAAVFCAALGVGLLALGALSTLWFSLSMAVTFALYGLIRKTVKAGALAGMTIETLVLLIPALLIAAWYGGSAQGSAMLREPSLSFFIALGGPLTGIPLLMFATAARKMDYTVIGFLQFLSPTIVFLLGLLVFQEQLKPAQLGCFILIWAAMAFFIQDMLRARRRLSA